MDPYAFDFALVRCPGRSVTHGLRSGDGPSPSYEDLVAEHEAYVAALEEAGLTVFALAPDEDHPDGLFVEDPVLVFPEAAILLRPGTASRVGEAQAIRPALDEHFSTVIELDGGHVEGGDVLVTRDLVLIGLSQRTNRRGARALSEALERLGRPSRIVSPPPGALHLKSAAILIDEETILTTRAHEEAGIFTRFRQLVVPLDEEAAANTLRVNDLLLVGEQYRQTNEMLDREGFALVPLPTEQIGRIDAGLTCLSVRWQRRPALN